MQIKITPETHRRLKVAASEKGRKIGEMGDEIISKALPPKPSPKTPKPKKP